MAKKRRGGSGASKGISDPVAPSHVSGDWPNPPRYQLVDRLSKIMGWTGHEKYKLFSHMLSAKKMAQLIRKLEDA